MAAKFANLTASLNAKRKKKDDKDEKSESKEKVDSQKLLKGKESEPEKKKGREMNVDRRPPPTRTVSATPRGTKSPPENSLSAAPSPRPGEEGESRRRPSLDHNKSLDRLQRMQIDLNKKRAMARGEQVTGFTASSDVEVEKEKEERDTKFAEKQEKEKKEKEEGGVRFGNSPSEKKEEEKGVKFGGDDELPGLFYFLFHSIFLYNLLLIHIHLHIIFIFIFIFIFPSYFFFASTFQFCLHPSFSLLFSHHPP